MERIVNGPKTEYEFVREYNFFVFAAVDIYALKEMRDCHHLYAVILYNF